MDINLGCGNAFVAEPERDDGGVDSGVQQPHGCGVAQDLRGDPFLGEGRAGQCGGRSVLGYSPFEGVSGDGRA